jgi:hypothetical protein
MINQLTGFQFAAVHQVGPFAVQFSWIMPLFNSVPLSLLKKMAPGMTEFIQFKSVWNNK